MIVRRIRYDETIDTKEDLCACIGYFDGMHKGHMQLVSKTLEIAKLHNMKSALITFDPDPWVVLKGINPAHITSMDERIAIGESFGLDEWIIVDFSRGLSQLSYEAFEDEILVKLHVKHLICGFDYSYGYKGSGNTTTLIESNKFDVHVIEPVEYNNEKISSTRIENEIKNGNVDKVTTLLGRPYSIKGTIIKGSAIGRTIGFPTANIQLKYDSLIPKKGVYIGYTLVDGKNIRSMMNIGHNPSINFQQELRIESHLLDFNEDLYGKEVEVIFIKRIRDEQRFNNKEELINQMKKDVLEASRLPK